jgi:DNA-binding beta-propeller fold protein YncE
LAFQNGFVYVSSVFADSVFRYDETTGESLGAFVPSGYGGMNRPWHGIFGPDGNFYVANASEPGIVRRYDGITGTYMGPFVPAHSGGLVNAGALVFGPDGNLYVIDADLNTSAVMRYDGNTGAPLPAPGQPGAIFVPPHSGGLNTLWGTLAFGPDGNLYVSSYGTNNVLRFDATTGDFIDQFVPSGSGGLSGTHGIAFGPDGNLYVSSHLTNSVLRYDGSTGAFIDVFVPPVQLNGPTDLVFWDTESGSPRGSSRVRNHQVTVSAVHAASLADSAALVGLVSISERPHVGDALGSAALSSDPRPANAVTPAPAVWTITVDSVAAAIPSVAVSRSRMHAAADTLFGAWPTETSSLEPLAWFGGL